MMVYSIPGYVDDAQTWVIWIAGIPSVAVAWFLLLLGFAVTLLGNWDFLSKAFTARRRGEEGPPPPVVEVGQTQEPRSPSAGFKGEYSSTVFGWRMAKAFPGSMGLVEFEGAEAAARLAIVLEDPLGDESFKPFWWFRGGMSSEISLFSRIADDFCIFDHIEAPLGRLVGFRSYDERREFVYLEILASEPTGLYEHRDRAGRVPRSEEYAILGDHLLTLSEFMDGWTRIDGELVRTDDAERRYRYLDRYNFVITSKFSPINSPEFDTRSADILDGILQGTATTDDLRDMVLKLPQRSYDAHTEPW